MSSLSKRTIDDVDFAGKRVLMRVDFNVPQTSDGTITNTQRIVAAIPTIQRVLDSGAKSVVLMSHLGRPNGRKDAKFTLRPVAEKLGELMKRDVKFLDDCVGEEVAKACADPAPGSVIVLENMRFHPEEEGKGVDENGEKVKPSEDDVAKFRASLSGLGDVYVCDAFGTAHRAHISVVGMRGKMPCVSGLLVAKELEAFSRVLDPTLKKTPLTSIVGGAKIKDKVLVIENLIDASDSIIICGGMAYTFLKTCFGMNIGNSLFDKKGAELAPGLLKKAEERGCKLVFPCDWACGREFKNDQDVKMVTQEEGIPDGWEGESSPPIDCAPSVARFAHE